MGTEPDNAPNAEILAQAADAARRAVRAGQFAPTFRLADLHGGNAALVDLIGQHSLVISFHRGAWCSFCDSALAGLARIDDQIRAQNALQVAIGPPPTNDEQRQRLEALPMPVLIDRGLQVASAYGLTITLPDALQGSYLDAGYRPPRDGDWQVPIPATYVIDRTGRIAMASIDLDYRRRLDPPALLSALRSLRQRAHA